MMGSPVLLTELFSQTGYGSWNAKLSEYEFAVLFYRPRSIQSSQRYDGTWDGRQTTINLSNKAQECVRAVDMVAWGGDELPFCSDGRSGTCHWNCWPNSKSLSQPFDLDGREFFTALVSGISFSSLRVWIPEYSAWCRTLQCIRAKMVGKAPCNLLTSAPSWKP